MRRWLRVGLLGCVWLSACGGKLIDGGAHGNDDARTRVGLSLYYRLRGDGLGDLLGRREGAKRGRRARARAERERLRFMGVRRRYKPVLLELDRQPRIRFPESSFGRQSR